MSVDAFSALLVFASVMAFTPGPNNIMLTASGVNFGFSRTIPHMCGIGVGFLVLMTACAAGLGLAFSTLPKLQNVLKFLGAAYMIWLAWKVAASGASDKEDNSLARPLTFVQAAAFQWVNPKGVFASISAITLFIRPGHEQFDVPIVLSVFGVCTLGAVTLWTGFGVALRRLLRNPLHARIFNVTMALLLVASIVPMVM